MFNSSSFGERLRKARLSAGYTKQEDLAKAVGISIQSISSYENGRRLPDAEIISKLSQKLGYTADYLLLREDGTTHEISNLVEYTGLSEESLMLLHDGNKSVRDRIRTAANALLSSEKGVYFLLLLYKYFYSEYTHVQIGKSSENDSVKTFGFNGEGFPVSDEVMLSMYNTAEKNFDNFSAAELREIMTNAQMDQMKRTLESIRQAVRDGHD